jgi:hypothetical protein
VLVESVPHLDDGVAERIEDEVRAFPWHVLNNEDRPTVALICGSHAGHYG